MLYMIPACRKRHFDVHGKPYPPLDSLSFAVNWSRDKGVHIRITESNGSDTHVATCVYVSIEPMPRRDPVRLKVIRLECVEQLNARSGPYFLEVAKYAANRHIAFFTPLPTEHS